MWRSVDEMVTFQSESPRRAIRYLKTSVGMGIRHRGSEIVNTIPLEGNWS
jgi:hypothetical protein